MNIEFKRMQQLAGLLTEINVNSPVRLLIVMDTDERWGLLVNKKTVFGDISYEYARTKG